MNTIKNSIPKNYELSRQKFTLSKSTNNPYSEMDLKPSGDDYDNKNPNDDDDDDDDDKNPNDDDNQNTLKSSSDLFVLTPLFKNENKYNNEIINIKDEYSKLIKFKDEISSLMNLYKEGYNTEVLMENLITENDYLLKTNKYFKNNSLENNLLEKNFEDVINIIEEKIKRYDEIKISKLINFKNEISTLMELNKTHDIKDCLENLIKDNDDLLIMHEYLKNNLLEKKFENVINIIEEEIKRYYNNKIIANCNNMTENEYSKLINLKNEISTLMELNKTDDIKDYLEILIKDNDDLLRTRKDLKNNLSNKQFEIAINIIKEEINNLNLIEIKKNMIILYYLFENIMSITKELRINELENNEFKIDELENHELNDEFLINKIKINELKNNIIEKINSLFLSNNKKIKLINDIEIIKNNEPFNHSKLIDYVADIDLLIINNPEEVMIKNIIKLINNILNIEIDEKEYKKHVKNIFFRINNKINENPKFIEEYNITLPTLEYIEESLIIDIHNSYENTNIKLKNIYNTKKQKKQKFLKDTILYYQQSIVDTLESCFSGQYVMNDLIEIYMNICKTIYKYPEIIDDFMPEFYLIQIDYDNLEKKLKQLKNHLKTKTDEEKLRLKFPNYKKNVERK